MSSKSFENADKLNEITSSSLEFHIECNQTADFVVTNDNGNTLLAQFNSLYFKTPVLINAIDDAAAQIAGVPVGGFYQNSGAVRQRLA